MAPWEQEKLSFRMRTANSAPKLNRPQRLMTEERRREILALLGQQGRVTVEDLTRRFSVSAVTARGDLDALSAAGALVRSHGGAVPPLNPAQDYPLAVKESIHQEEKVRIARAAAQLVKSGQTIILDAGTTAAQVALQIKKLKLPSLTVITHALNIAARLADAPNISIIFIGGIMRPLSTSCVGPHAEQMMRDLHADHFFVSVDGLDPDVGLSTPDILEAQLNTVMIRSAKETTVISDASKFGRRSLSVIGGIDSIQRVITDAHVSPGMVDTLRSHGIEVIIV